jgi:hypothetical protein
MGWIRRVWDGPFKTPPQQPITVGWALLKLFETLWRLLLIVILLIALLALYVWQAELNPLSSQVGIQLNPAGSYCLSKGWPIHALIENKSSKTIGEVGLKFRVYPQGTSTDVVSYDYLQPDLHNILKPGEVLDWCFSMPQLQAGSTGPYTVAADVSYAFELPKDVPVTSQPQPPSQGTPPPLVQINPLPLHPSAPPQTVWTKIVGGIVVLVCLALFAGGGLGLIALCHRLFKVRVMERFRGKKDDNVFWPVFLFTILNLVIVWAGSFAISSLGWDAWETQLDTWSWAHGLQDGGTMLLTAIACQWPWALWFALSGPQHAEV